MSGSKRIAAVDTARGILILCMVVFHALYIAVMFKFSTVDLWSGFWWWFARFTAAGFVLLAGWSYAAQSRPAPAFKIAASYRAMAKRALKLGMVSVIITVVTVFAFGKTGFVFFGVLHLITVCYLIAWPLRKRALIAAFAAVLTLTAGLVLGRYSFSWPWLSWLGLRPKNLYPADYLPLLPWAAWFFAGIALYPLTIDALKTRASASSSARVDTDAKPLAFPLRQLAFAGRHSLVIYLGHLPSLYGLAWLLSLLVRTKG